MPERGAALVESLAALLLMGIAGAIVASAATTSLRAVRRAEACERLTAIAARELALLQARDAPEGTVTRWLDDPGAAMPERLTTTAHRRLDGVAELVVTAEGDPDGVTATSVTVATHLAPVERP